jgi:membrane protease YdiL (CAAX protease family)
MSDAVGPVDDERPAVTPGIRPVPDVPPPPAGVAGRSGPGRAAPTAHDGGPRVGLAVGAIGTYFVGQLVIGVVAATVLSWLGIEVGPSAPTSTPGALDEGTALLALAVSSQIGGLAAVLWLLRRRGHVLTDLVGRRRPFGRLAGVGLGVGLLAWLGSTVVVAVLVAVSGSERVPEQALTGSLSDGILPLLLAVVAAVVMAPIAEELLFRGLLHRALRRRRSLPVATAVSSLAFAVVHVDVAFSQPLALVGLVIVGAALAVAYERTGSLVVPIVMHAVHNGVAITALVVTERLGIELVAGALAWWVRVCIGWPS